LSGLDHSPTVVAIGERPKIDGKKQKRRPVANDGKTAENGRVKLFEQQPVANHVFDVISHGREQEDKKISAVIPMVQRRERNPSLRRPAGGCHLFFFSRQHDKSSRALGLWSGGVMADRRPMTPVLQYSITQQPSLIRIRPRVQEA
jgi:hypothetical protein